MKKRFDEPTQVLFMQEEHAAEWFGGIAFNDYVICGECGAIIPLNEITKLHELSWVNISDTISCF